MKATSVKMPQRNGAKCTPREISTGANVPSVGIPTILRKMQTTSAPSGISSRKRSAHWPLGERCENEASVAMVCQRLDSMPVSPVCAANRVRLNSYVKSSM
ncbi:MAG: hypothetical protein BWZ07_03110 [Alphaproteobacteria bacterium ADurb.BinA280]|nr:MAG: hypothetical protein BWZ07_03110 [Alphaproteobacteria bacterium ADurb.BinA280]